MHRLDSFIGQPYRWGKLYLVAITVLICSSCVTTRFDESYITQSIEKLSDYGAGREGSSTNLQIPDNVNLYDGLSEDEAVSLALYNNAQFQTDLLDLSIANADLVTAGQLPNPLLSIILPTGTDPLKGTLNLGIDALWQRPARVRAAHQESERTALVLVNKGLQLIRDTKIAYANNQIANQLVSVGSQNIELRGQLAQIVYKQYEAGELSEMEASLAISDSTIARQDIIRAANTAQLSQLQLMLITGLDSIPKGLEVKKSKPSATTVVGLERLLDTAFAKRTDLKAAQLAIEAKGSQLGWEKSKIVSLMGILSARRENGELFIGPGVNLGVPIFNWNQGNIQRKNAEMKQAAWQYVLTKRTVRLEVNQAHATYNNALLNAQLWESNVLAMDKVPEQARKAFEAGEVPYLFYLETLRRFTEYQLRSADAAAALSIAAANLNYAVGVKQL